jgi:hypothetical protein
MQGFGELILSQPKRSLTPETDNYLKRVVNSAIRMDALIRDSFVVRQNRSRTHPAGARAISLGDPKQSDLSSRLSHDLICGTSRRRKGVEEFKGETP